MSIQPDDSADIPVASVVAEASAPPTLDYMVPLESESAKAWERRVWKRFGARCLDSALFGIVIAIPIIVVEFAMAAGSRQPAPMALNESFLAGSVTGLFTTVIRLTVEMFMLARFGTTPGKAFMGMRLVTPTGETPTLSQAWGRIWRYWAGVETFGLPVLSVIGMLVVYFRFRKLQKAWYDKNAGVDMAYTPISIGRVFLLFGALIGLYVATFYLMRIF